MSLLDQYDRSAVGWLPRLTNPKPEHDDPGLEVHVPQGAEPVVQVIHEPTGEVLYTLRVPTQAISAGFRPRTFSLDPHTLRIRIGGKVKELTGIEPIPATREE